MTRNNRAAGVTEPQQLSPMIQALHDAWVKAGRPSTRDIAKRSGVPHAVVHQMLTGQHDPSTARYRLVAKALGMQSVAFD